ncbi:MAG: DeoR family transcriptional regulator [Chloroflexi bacterium]|uniref:DeoR family transcriptional regulator n=2 Tax=Candidatus Chlorohelix allophototropha TaxID=3003348 RepID=A0A8T7M4T3_9CHLR|nr:DeoR family transcriptional regulator [Chloroflexota bacterium]
MLTGSESLSRQEYEKAFNVSDRTAKEDLKKLRELGLIHTQGSARSLRYRLIG